MKFPVKALKTAGATALAALSAAVIGCDWTSNTDDFNSRYNYVNFSGVYRGINGGLLVTDYSSEIDTPVSEGSVGSTNNVASETIAKGNGASTSFSGFLDQNNILAGSLTISAAGYTFTDPEGDGTLAAQDGAFGNINYGSGQWDINFNGVAPGNGVNIVASYKFVIEPEQGNAQTGTGSGPLGNATSGASGAEIYAFTVEHYGNRIRIVDNNGASYEGDFGDIRTTSGLNQDNQDDIAQQNAPLPGDTFIGSFTATGVSKAGKQVKMTGTFQGVVETTAEGTFVMGDRQMLGTWIETNGRTGNITGEASPITIVVPQTTTTGEGGGEGEGEGEGV